jgi:glutathione S-transferase
MKLFYDPATTSSRIVTFFLFDHNIPFDDEILSTAAGQQRDPAFLKLNPNGLLPVLVEDDGMVLTESVVILRHLSMKYQLPTYPDAVQDRMRVDEVASWFQTTFHLYHCALLSYTHILPVFASMEPKALATLRSIGTFGSQKYLAVLNDAILGNQTYVCGEAITIADYIGAAYVTLGDFASIELDAYANIRRWLQTLKIRRGWQRAYAAFDDAVSAIRSHDLTLA